MHRSLYMLFMFTPAHGWLYKAWVDNFNNFFLRIVSHTTWRSLRLFLQHTVVLKIQLNSLNYIQSFQVCVAIVVIISIITTTCVLGGNMKRFWSSIRNHACFLCDIIIEYSRGLWSGEENSMLSINWFRSINKVKGLRMETNVDKRRISLVELQTLVSLSIWSSVHKVWLHDFVFSLNTLNTEKDQVIAFATTDCLWSAECACLFNVLAFQFLHSLPVIILLFLCFTHNLQIIKLSSDSK